METLYEGAHGPAVKNAQHALNYHLPTSVPPLVEDGIFGKNTKARALEFQIKFGLRKKDGIIGPETNKALYCFVKLSHHLLMSRYSLTLPSLRSRLNLVGDGDPVIPNFPPLPALDFPFPDPFHAPLPVPNLTLDPDIWNALRQIKFELEIGKERTFEKNLGNSDPVKAQTQLFADLKGTVWSKPFSFLGKNEAVELSLSVSTGIDPALSWAVSDFGVRSVSEL